MQKDIKKKKIISKPGGTYLQNDFFGTQLGPTLFEKLGFSRLFGEIWEIGKGMFDHF